MLCSTVQEAAKLQMQTSHSIRLHTFGPRAAGKKQELCFMELPSVSSYVLMSTLKSSEYTNGSTAWFTLSLNDISVYYMSSFQLHSKQTLSLGITI